MEPAFTCAFFEVFGFLACVGLDAPHGVDQVAFGGGVARDALHFASGCLPTMLYSYDVVLAHSSYNSWR